MSLDLKNNVQLREQRAASAPISESSSSVPEDAVLCTPGSGESNSNVFTPKVQVLIDEGVSTTSSYTTIPLHTKPRRHQPRDAPRSTFPKPTRTPNAVRRRRTPIFRAPELLSIFLKVDKQNDCLRYEAGIAISEGRVQDGEDMLKRRILEGAWDLDFEMGAADVEPQAGTHSEGQLHD